MNPVADRPNNSARVLIIPSISAGCISVPLIASGRDQLWRPAEGFHIDPEGQSYTSVKQQ